MGQIQEKYIWQGNGTALFSLVGSSSHKKCLDKYDKYS